MSRTKADAKPHKGAWTAAEDRKLAEAMQVHSPKQWATVAAKSGLIRCTKGCRLRWMNYLRSHIKSDNFSDQEEDLILRLHKLIGNRGLTPIAVEISRSISKNVEFSTQVNNGPKY